METNVLKVTRPRACGYVRVSTSEQAESGYSIEAQKQVIKEYCAKQGFDLTHIYADPGVSGKSLKKRVQMKTLLLDAEEDKFDVVVVWKNSRLARNLLDLLGFLDIFDKHNVAFHSISEQFQIDTATGKMMIQIMASFSEYERNNIAENVRLGMKKRARDGYANVGAVLGYDPVVDADGKRNLAINADEAEIVHTIFEHSANGKGYRAIANLLNRRGYKTKQGNTFSTTAVKDIVSNPLYNGRIRYNRYENWDRKRRQGLSDDLIEGVGHHPAIIDDDLWRRAQDQLESTSMTPKWNDEGTNVLTGLLRCPECGGPMAASNTTNTLKDGTRKRIRYYSCANSRNKGAKVCHANSIRADVAEALVAQRLQAVMSNPDIAQTVVDHLLTSQEMMHDEIQSQIDLSNVDVGNLSKKIGRMQELFDTEPELAKEALTRKKELEFELATAQQKIHELTTRLDEVTTLPKVADVQWLLKLIATICADKQTKVLKALYRVFIDKITFDKKEKLVYITMDVDQKVIDKLNQDGDDAEGHRPFCMQPMRLVL